VVVRPQIQATLLTIIAGISDAVGYITMGGVFAANMTGNTVLAGIALAEGRYPDAGRHLAPLVAFFIGAMLARLLLRLWHRPMIPILLEAAIIGAMGFLPLANESAVLVLAFAMGLQASAITQFGGVSVSTVVVTSTLARTADAALDRLWPDGPHVLPAVATPSLLLMTWTGYLVGALAGGLLLDAMAWPLLVPVVLLVIVTLL
jgi:uncharacterized membrane protein YoaK (UPF0700 family)